MLAKAYCYKINFLTLIKFYKVGYNKYCDFVFQNWNSREE